MALEPGTLTIVVEYAKDLKDKDWFGKQDPYAVLRIGTNTFRTKTHTDGGKNPVWNETFTVNVINDNSVDITIYDSDVGKDDVIGTAVVSLAKAREQGSDYVQAAVRTKSGKQHGYIAVKLNFARNAALKGHGGPAPAYGAPPAAAYPPPAGYPPQPAPGGYPQPGYPPQAPPAAYPPPGGYPPPAQGAYPPPAGYPPQAPPAAYPPQAPPASYPPPGGYPPPAGYPPAQGGYPPQAYGAHPPPAYGHAPQPGYGAHGHGAHGHGGGGLSLAVGGVPILQFAVGGHPPHGGAHYGHPGKYKHKYKGYKKKKKGFGFFKF